MRRADTVDVLRLLATLDGELVGSGVAGGPTSAGAGLRRTARAPRGAAARSRDGAPPRAGRSRRVARLRAGRRERRTIAARSRSPSGSASARSTAQVEQVRVVLDDEPRAAAPDGVEIVSRRGAARALDRRLRHRRAARVRRHGARPSRGGDAEEWESAWLTIPPPRSSRSPTASRSAAPAFSSTPTSRSGPRTRSPPSRRDWRSRGVATALKVTHARVGGRRRDPRGLHLDAARQRRHAEPERAPRLRHAHREHLGARLAAARALGSPDRDC